MESIVFGECGFSFKKGGRKSDDQDNPEIEKLYAQIGQLKFENDFFKKNCRKLGI